MLVRFDARISSEYDQAIRAIAKRLDMSLVGTLRVLIVDGQRKYLRERRTFDIVPLPLEKDAIDALERIKKYYGIISTEEAIYRIIHEWKEKK